jgi:hypothetical protein
MSLANLKDPFEEPAAQEEDVLALVPVVETAAVEKHAEARLPEIQSLHDKAMSITEVSSPEENSAVISLQGQVQTLIKKHDGERTEVTKNWRDAVSRVNRSYNQGTDLLKKSKSWLAQLQKTWSKKLEMERRQKQAIIDKHTKEMQQDFDRVSKEQGFEPVNVAPLTVPKSEGPQRGLDGSSSYTRGKWVVEILWPQAVPREYCEPSMKLLEAAAKGGIRNIPGCNIYFDEKIIVKS